MVKLITPPKAKSKANTSPYNLTGILKIPNLKLDEPIIGGPYFMKFEKHYRITGIVRYNVSDDNPEKTGREWVFD